MKILCIGRNYAAHAQELNNPLPQQPLCFLKPATALLHSPKPFYHPDFSSDIHHELELVLKICKQGKAVRPEFARDYFEEITLGLDFTARDLQEQCKTQGWPWEIAKAFDNSAVVGPFIPLEQARDDDGAIRFSLHKNGQIQQQGSTLDLLWNFEALIVHLSKFFTLQKGDLIFTGTPKGVSQVKIGDKLEGFIKGQSLLSCEIK